MEGSIKPKGETIGRWKPVTTVTKPDVRMDNRTNSRGPTVGTSRYSPTVGTTIHVPRTNIDLTRTVSSVDFVENYHDYVTNVKPRF